MVFRVELDTTFLGKREHPETYFRLTRESGLVRFALG
jgi:hypothetical protein